MEDKGIPSPDSGFLGRQTTPGLLSPTGGRAYTPATQDLLDSPVPTIVPSVLESRENSAISVTDTYDTALHRDQNTFVKENNRRRDQRISSSDSTIRRYGYQTYRLLTPELTRKVNLSPLRPASVQHAKNALRNVNGIIKRNADVTLLSSSTPNIISSQTRQVAVSRIPQRKMTRTANKENRPTETQSDTEVEIKSMTLKQRTGKYILQRLAERVAINPRQFEKYDLEGKPHPTGPWRKEEKKQVIQNTNNVRNTAIKNAQNTTTHNERNTTTKTTHNVRSPGWNPARSPVRRIPRMEESRYIDHGQLATVNIQPNPRLGNETQHNNQTNPSRPKIKKVQPQPKPKRKYFIEPRVKAHSQSRVNLSSAEKFMLGPRKNIESWVRKATETTSHGLPWKQKPEKVKFSGTNIKRRVRRRKRNSDVHGSYLYRMKGKQAPASHASTTSTKSVGYQSEIPLLNYSGDEEEVYQHKRPLTDNVHNRYPNHRRFEPDNIHEDYRLNFRGPAHMKNSRSNGALVRFYLSGDKKYHGVQMVINRKNYINLEVLLIDLSVKFDTASGVLTIFKLPGFQEIKSVTEFENRCCYVASCTTTVDTTVNYGESLPQWSHKKLSAGRMRKSELGLFQRPVSPKNFPSNVPIRFTIISNMSRGHTERVILNPQTQQPFEEWIADIDCAGKPVRTLYTDKPPYNRIESFSTLFQKLRKTNILVACGDELEHLQLKKRQAPSSNSSSDTISERGQKKRQSRQYDMGQINEYGRPLSPTSTAMSRYDTGPVKPMAYYARGRHMDSRRNPRELVEVEIDGLIREFVPPSYADPEDDGQKPDVTLKTEWIYGFHGKETQQNLLVLPGTGELLYYVASVIVLYDKDRDTQRLYTKHNEEITCMTLHPKKELVATGQLHGKNPEHAAHVRIWHGVTLSTHHIIGTSVFQACVLSVGFSHDKAGNFMCALDGSDKHVLSIWNWAQERMVARTTTSTDVVHCACFYPDNDETNVIITYGARHIFFWRVFFDQSRKKDARILRDRNSGIFENDVPSAVNCIGFLDNGDVVSGDTNGNLLVWKRDETAAFTCRQVVQAHKNPIHCMCVLEDGTVLTGSGNEISAWDSNSSLATVKSRQVPHEAGDVKVIISQTPGGIDGKLFLGTTKSSILEGSMQLRFRYLVQGHSEGVRGVATHPFEPTFVTVGTDEVVFKWSRITHNVIWRAQVQAPCTCVSIYQPHEMVAVGTEDSCFFILNGYNGMHVNSVDVGCSPVICLAFSPDATVLAVGSAEGLITLFEVRDRGTNFRMLDPPLRGHRTGVKNIDWSSDSQCLQSVGEDFELLFWNRDTKEEITIPHIMRDVDWFTNSAVVSYNVIGAWSNLERGELIRATNRSTYRDFFLVGDNKGRIRLYKYPCSRENAEFRSVRHYSSDVTAVAFTMDNRIALSCGGNGCALIQWALTDSF